MLYFPRTDEVFDMLPKCSYIWPEEKEMFDIVDFTVAIGALVVVCNSHLI